MQEETAIREGQLYYLNDLPRPLRLKAIERFGLEAKYKAYILQASIFCYWSTIGKIEKV